jgi:hypothetical protein
MIWLRSEEKGRGSGIFSGRGLCRGCPHNEGAFDDEYLNP